MSYRKAEEILPQELIDWIQEYIDGENIYIPRKAEHKKEWGSSTTIKQELSQRNQNIYSDAKNGFSVRELSKQYFLSEKSIQRILRNQK